MPACPGRLRRGRALCSLPAPASLIPRRAGVNMGTQELEPPWFCLVLRMSTWKLGLQATAPRDLALLPASHHQSQANELSPSGPKWGCDLGTYFWKRTYLELGGGIGLLRGCPSPSGWQSWLRTDLRHQKSARSALLHESSRAPLVSSEAQGRT